MIFFYLSLGGAFLFYLCIPLFFLLQEAWRQFQMRELLSLGDSGESIHFKGYRYSDPEDHKLWIQNEGQSALLQLKGAEFYRISEQGSLEERDFRHIYLTEFLDISEGTAIDIIGNSHNREGVLYFSAEKKSPVFVLLGNDPKKSWSESLKSCLDERHYFHLPRMNRSYFLGAILSILFMSLSIIRGIPTGFIMVHIIMALIPLFPLIPPGLLFYLLSLSFWRQKKAILGILSFAAMVGANAVTMFYFLWKLLLV